MLRVWSNSRKRMNTLKHAPGNLPFVEVHWRLFRPAGDAQMTRHVHDFGGISPGPLNTAMTQSATGLCLARPVMLLLLFFSAGLAFIQPCVATPYEWEYT